MPAYRNGPPGSFGIPRENEASTMSQTAEKQDGALHFSASRLITEKGAEAWLRFSRIGFLVALVAVLSIIALTGLAQSLLPFV